MTKIKDDMEQMQELKQTLFRDKIPGLGFRQWIQYCVMKKHHNMINNKRRNKRGR